VTDPLAPPPAVLAAFGVEVEPRPLAEPTWRAGDLVLKPDTHPELQAWLATEIAPALRRGFRLADPLPAQDGSWVVQGWSATRWVDGRSVPATGPSVERWQQALEAGRAFHRAVAHVKRPGFFERLDSWWARADRRTWAESGPAEPVPQLAPTARVLESACRPLGGSQVVHGDLAGNVLLADGLPPAVIDVSPYWRPPALAEGVLVADALCWYGAEPTLLEDLDVSVPAVARAMLFRLWTTHERVVAGVRVEDLDAEARAYATAAAAIGLG
jgi:hypothetical protein